MKPELRSKYAEYIAAGVRFIEKETGLKLPDDTIIVTKSYGELATIDTILGMDVYVMDMPSAYEFFIAFKTYNVVCYKLQKEFIEFTGLYAMGDPIDNDDSDDK